MQALPINLDIYCESCNSNEYSEHESGFYVCSVCGVLTQVRYGIGLDYADLHKSSMVIRRKVVDEDEDYNNDNNDSNPKATGFNKEEDNNRKRIKEEEQKREPEAENQRNVYENDKDIHIDNIKEDKMNVEKDSQKVKEDAFLPEDKEEDLKKDQHNQHDQQMEVEIDPLPVTENKKLNQIKLEMDKDIDMLDIT